MEWQPSKRRRVYSLEPNKQLVQAMFARNYVNYLVPALMKIKKSSATDNNNNSHCDLVTVVKHEVDMAMAFSAEGFAWSNALKVKLQGDVNARRSTLSIAANEGGERSSRPYDQDTKVPLDFSSNPSSKSKTNKKLVSRSDGLLEMKKELATEENEDDENTSCQLRSLRRLLPGGEEMCDEQMVGELESYISSLQMQVNILQCMAETP